MLQTIATKIVTMSAYVINFTPTLVGDKNYNNDYRYDRL